MVQKMRFAYDKQADVLDISIGKPAQAISREIEDDLFIRFHPKTRRVVGISILNFTKWFKTLHDVRSIPIEAEFNLTHAL